MQNPFGDLIPGGQASPAPSAPPGLRRITPEKAPDPYQVGKDERSAAMEAERLRLAQEAAARERAKFEREQAKLAATGGVDATGEEKTAAFLATRLVDGVKALRAHSGSQPSAVTEGVRWIAGDTPANYMTDANRQVVETNQLDVLDSALTLGTGAAYTKEQLEGYRKTYFPQLGDSPEVVAEKSRKLEVLLQAARLKAGSAAPMIDQALSTLSPDGGSRIGDMADTALSAFSTGQAIATNPDSPEARSAAAIGRQAGQDYRPERDEIVFGMDLPGSQTSNVSGTRISPQNEAAWAAFLKASAGDPSFSEAKANAFLSSLGEKGTLTFDPEFIESVRKGGAVPTGIDYSKTDEERRAEMEALAKDRYGDDPTSRAALLLKGGSLNLSDEVAGIGGAIYDTLTGGSAAEGYQRERDLERFVQDESRNNYGIGWELAGGLATPLGVMKKPGTVAEFAGQGAKLGAIAGFGEGEGTAGSIANAAAGAGVGYLAGGAVGKLANAGAARAATKADRQASRSALLQDFEAEGVRALPANVGGGGINRVTSGMSQSPIASDTIRNAAEEQAAGFANAVKRNAGRAGKVLPEDEAGEAFRKAAKTGIERDGKRIGRIYEAANKVAEGVKVKPNQGVRMIDEEIARLSETKAIEGPLIKELTKLRASLTQNPAMSVEGLKRARSFAGKAASTEALRNTDAKATLKRVFGALADDFDGGLRSAGREKAADLFRKADDLWSARIDDIDNSWEPVIGKGKSGEQIVESIENMARGKGGGYARLKTVMSGTTPAERSDIVATVIDRMGRASPGRQGAANDTYSADTFLTNWSKMSDKAKELIFSGPQTRESMDRLARIAGSVKETGRYANASNTSGGIMAQLFAGSLGYAVGDVTGLAAPAATTYLTGRLMASPRFVNWLARAPKNMTPAAAKTYTGKLRGIAAAEPAIAGDVTKFAQFMNAANDASPARAVAQGQDEDN